MKVYKVKEAAEILKVSYQKILEMIKNGEIKSFKIGADYRVTEENLKAFMAGE